MGEAHPKFSNMLFDWSNGWWRHATSRKWAIWPAWPGLWPRVFPLLVPIATFAWNPLQWLHPVWLFFSVGFPACILSDSRTRRVCTLHMHGHLYKWAGACRDRPRTPESWHALYTVSIDKVTDNTDNKTDTAVCAIIRGWMGHHFFHRRLLYWSF